MTERRKKLLKWVGYPALGFLTFIFALHFTFPYERLRERLVEVASKDFDVGIGEIGPGWLPGRVNIKSLSLTTRPKREDEKPKTLLIDEVSLSIGLLPLITKTISIDFDASLGGGEIEGNVASSSSGVTVEIETNNVSLEAVPGIGTITGGAPIKGPFEAKVRINLPKGKWAAAGGMIDLKCEGCSVGDGVTKVRPMHQSQRNAFTDEGFTLPRLDMGTFTARIPINKGVACLERFETKGGSIMVLVEGGVKFADPFTATTSELQARVKVAEEFRKASIQNAALFAGDKDADGFMTYQSRTQLTSPLWRPSRTALTQMRECEGVAPPPTPPKAIVAGGRMNAPSVPVPTTSEEPLGAGAQPPAPPQPVPTPPPPNVVPPEPQPPQPPPQPQPEVVPPPAPVEITPPPQPIEQPPPAPPPDVPPPPVPPTEPQPQ